MKAIDAVANLRKLAHMLETHPEAEIDTAYFSIGFYDKASFLAVAQDMPRPFEKVYETGSYPDLRLSHGGIRRDGIILLTIPRDKACTLVEPAKPAVYDCDPILSADEEAQLEGAK
jgi:hypothetical protein